MFDWLSCLFPRPSRTARRSGRPSFRPRLEVLEDRITPATIWDVNLTTDTGGQFGQKGPGMDAGDLRYCITNATAGDTINFDAVVFQNPTTINLTSALPINNNNLTIDGQKLDITIAGNNTAPNTCRIFTITGTSNVEIDNLTLASGKAVQNDNGGYGGAIDDTAAKLTLTNDEFLKNAAFASGGAIYMGATAGPLTVTNCSFAYNTAGDSGGAISTSATAQNVVRQSSFQTNIAGDSGGAINADKGPAAQLSMSNCTFQGNRVNASSEGEGGAVFSTDQFQDIGSTYTNNSVLYNGGAIAWQTPSGGSTAAKDVLNVSYDTFASIQAQTGGGMYIQALANQGNVTQTILGCLFNANQVPSSGGGLSAQKETAQTGSATLSVYNSTFYQNTAEGDGIDGNGNGGGIDLLVNAAGTGTNIPRLTSLTVYQNSAGFDGGGLYVDPNSNLGAANAAVPQLYNSIIAGNQNGTSDFASGPDISGSIFSRSHNLVGVMDGANVTNGWQPTDIVGTLGSPQDAGLDPNGLTNNGGPTLTIKPVVGVSKAIGAGDNLAGKSDGTQLDQRGYARPGQKTTIGAYDPGAQVVQQGQSSTTVTSSANPAQPGQAVTLTALVAAVGGIPTGTVTFLDGTTTLATVNLDANGNATFSTSTLAQGSHGITATYSGDSNYAGSSGVLTQFIGQQTSSVNVTSSDNPAPTGQAVTFTANVSGDIGIPTGTVTFLDGTTTLGTSTLDANGNATLTASTLALGNHNITATYGGDTNYTGSSGSLTEVISQETNSTMSLVSSANPALAGQAVTFTATVSGSRGTPTGSVTFLDGTTVLGTASLGTNGSAAFSTSALLPGSQTITALYDGDSTYDDSGVSLTQTVNLAGTITSVSSSSNPSQPGQTITFTATVQATGSGTPTGSVTFFDGTTMLGTGTLAPINGQDQATFATSVLASGSHTITAGYSGDSTFAGSSGTQTQTVGQASGSSSMTSLSSSAASALLGQSVTFTATVMGSGTPTGTVSFMDGATLLGTSTLAQVNGQSQTTFTTSTLGLGSHDILAVYSGDNIFANSSSSLLQMVNQTGTSSSVTSSSSPGLLGQPVTFTVTVTGTGAGTPTSLVTFMDGSTLLGTATLSQINGQARASFTTSALALGRHTLTAIYSGDNTFAGNSLSFTQVISQETSSSVSLSSSANPAVPGQAVTFTATVSGNSGTPTGTVTFLDGTTALGTATVGSNGRATLTTSALQLGSQPIAAIYSGDSTYGNRDAYLTQTVSQAASLTSLTSSASPSQPGQAVTFTATVSPQGNSTTPTGTVTFLDGTMTLGTGSLALLNGQLQASLTSSALALGSHAILAVYSGDSVFAGSDSSLVEAIGS